MTGSAWGMLIGTWTVVIGFAGFFFLKVIRTPIRSGEGAGAEE